MAEFDREMDMEMDVPEVSTEEAVEENGNAKKGIIAAVALGATAAITTVVCKKLKVREKLNERRIRKLEKKGYIITKIDEPDEESDVDYDEE